MLSSRGVNGDGKPECSTKVVLLNAGVSPLDAVPASTLDSGKGSENRTRFFDFDGVLDSCGVVLLLESASGC